MTLLKIKRKFNKFLRAMGLKAPAPKRVKRAKVTTPAVSGS